MSSQYAVHVARGSSYFMIQNISTSLLQLASFAILTRLISTEDIGVLAVLNLVSGISTTIGTLSLPNAVIKFVAEHLGRGERDSAASVFYQSLRTTFLFTVPLAIAVFLGASDLSSALLHEASYAVYFRYLAFDIVLASGLLPVLTAAFLGLQKFKQRATIFIVNAAIRQGFIIALIILLHDFFGLVIAWVLGDLILTVVCFVYFARILGGPKFNFKTRRLLVFSAPLWLSDAVGFASTWFDRALLVLFVPLATLGIYNATLTAFSVLVGIGGAATSTLLPAYSSMQQSDQRERLVPALKTSTRYASFVLVPLGFGLLATAKPALTLFVGQAYIDGTDPLMVLAGTYAVASVAAAATPMLIALGQTRLVSLGSVATVALSLAIAWILAPIFGMFGAALARGVGMIVGTALTILFLKRKMRVEFDTDGIMKSLIAAIVMTSVVIAVQALLYSRYLVPLYVTVGAFVYMGMLRLLKAIRQEDVQLVRGYLGPKLRFASDLLNILLSPSAE